MNLTDGMWHRLHPASPLLKGGFVLIAVLGVLFSNLRDRLVDVFLPQLPRESDPVDYIIDNGLLGYAALVVAAVLIVLVAAFYASWRMHTFRITEEVVEVRSGILFRTSRKARLDRIQGINIVRPFFARLFGAAKLEISQAGQDANVELSYLTSAAADGLRGEILRLASGARRHGPGAALAGTPAAAVQPAPARARPFDELFSSVRPVNSTAGESMVTINLGRLFGSLVLHSSTVFLVLFGIGVAVWLTTTGGFLALFFVLPSAVGFVGFYVRRFTKSLNYTIVSTPDGVRVGWGLLSTTSETLPPGRIHSVRVAQPLLWRPAGWWEISVNRASHSATRAAAGQSSATILPVGNLVEVKRVLALLLPDLAPEAAIGTARHGDDDPAVASQRVAALLHSGLTSLGGADDGFVNSPRRAVWLRPFSWRRNGFAVARGSLLLRRGGIWRELIVVPQARLQSVSLRQGPLLRLLDLASVHLHTVSGPISATLGAIDRGVAVDFFSDVARSAVVSAARDTSHRWRAGEAPA